MFLACWVENEADYFYYGNRYSEFQNVAEILAFSTSVRAYVVIVLKILL